MKKLIEVLNNKEDNYILPFFWQHGESEEVLREYMGKIYGSGIKAVCVESRPHPDFLGPKWWQDMDVILDEARKRSMKVWILDDSHFPTGYANGRIKEEFPNLQKLFLKVHQQDFVGPQKNAGIIVKWALNGSREAALNVEPGNSSINKMQMKDKILAVVAAKKLDIDEVNPDTLIDITKHINDGVIYWNMPEGDWRIFTMVQTVHGGEMSTEGYLNPINPEATQVLLDTVHEAHYNRYKDDFGTTIAGFFSDEPRFGNVKGPGASIGRSEMVLPWREDMVELLHNSMEEVIRDLPLLWVDGKSKEHEVRYKYMDTITKLYSENFTGKLGKWCRDHGVEYIGHVIEDNNAHARLGYGPGHFYRALWEQDMSGLDVVLHQIVPGMDKGVFKSFTSTGWDGEFFHYGLAKMGSSLGHIDNKKKGRTMCEVFGAYGWAEGLKMMKWITDHMLVRGVNYFVPHAFSPKEYPDTDCPPHFYAHGNNPQFKYMDVLNNYTNRISHLLTAGTHIAPVGILYHGEAEWSGDYMLFQKPARELMQNQIDFDILPSDIIISSKIVDNKLVVNDEKFSALVVPYAEALPKELIVRLLKYLRAGFKAYFINGLPIRSSEGIDVNKEINELQFHENCKVVELSNIANELKSKEIFDILAYNSVPYLRYYHYKHNDGNVVMFFNEDPYKSIETIIEVPLYQKAYLYDAFDNKLYEMETEDTFRGKRFKIELENYESKIIVFSDDIELGKVVDKSFKSDVAREVENVDGPWQVSFATSKEYPLFKNQFVTKELKNLAAPNLYPNFSGTVKYEVDFDVNRDFDSVLLAIKEVYEVVSVSLNEKSIGTKICPPYIFNISDVLQYGKNKLVIEVTNNLGKERKDFLSQYLIQEPTGIIGTVDLVFNK